LAVFVVGSSSEQQMLDTLVTFFFERLVKKTFENRIFVSSDGVADGRLGYTTMIAHGKILVMIDSIAAFRLDFVFARSFEHATGPHSLL
jgi:hypothetical protein